MRDKRFEGKGIKKKRFKDEKLEGEGRCGAKDEVYSRGDNGDKIQGVKG